ncbi:zf-HC2 domain-containing protein [Terrilactibacillus laevilacticus]|uniref:Anti-sigma-W factor RsiW n=1 Tax=Terrilactibacillus laevilacticus TaxID=1380157 RepID=A0ABW5PMS4_9BACI
MSIRGEHHLACSERIIQLMHKVLDGDATTDEEDKLMKHIETCERCRKHYEELQTSTSLLGQLPHPNPSLGFTDSVRMRLPSNRKPLVGGWFTRHPVIVAAAIFMILMSGYIFSTWNDNSFQATVDGKGHIAYRGNTVIVPKDEVINGDLIVQNGKVKIEGKVKGDVVLINSQSLQASAGHVTGDIEQINKLVSWVWYHIKHFFQIIF